MLIIIIFAQIMIDLDPTNYGSIFFFFLVLKNLITIFTCLTRKLINRLYYVLNLLNPKALKNTNNNTKTIKKYKDTYISLNCEREISPTSKKKKYERLHLFEPLLY